MFAGFGIGCCDDDIGDNDDDCGKICRFGVSGCDHVVDDDDDDDDGDDDGNNGGDHNCCDDSGGGHDEVRQRVSVTTVTAVSFHQLTQQPSAGLSSRLTRRVPLCCDDDLPSLWTRGITKASTARKPWLPDGLPVPKTAPPTQKGTGTGWCALAALTSTEEMSLAQRLKGDGHAVLGSCNRISGGLAGADRCTRAAARLPAGSRAPCGLPVHAAAQSCVIVRFEVPRGARR